ncbi:MAG TPA: DUF1080 domain-containing protein [Bryobacteraceae bacterium]|nr:DUF1080 domain-containing protein [Bryobacteraceae bacterium]
MRTLSLLLLALAACPTFAADARFNGRWDITSYTEPNNRAWWLEITGAETDRPKGKFVTAFAGDMNEIQEIAIAPGALRFGWLRTERPKPGDNTPPKTRHLVYKARIAGEKLEGTFEVEGEARPPIRWVGVRAPVIRDKDDGSWKEGKPVRLFNGKDLSGWKTPDGRPLDGWSVKDGCLVTSGKSPNIISGPAFWNFKLHLEYKVAPHSNSGVGLRARYEVQIVDDYGRPPDTHSNGSLYSRIAPTQNASKPGGEWQTYDIRFIGRQVTVVLNDKTIINKGEVEGLTAIAVDPNESQPGPLYLQGDHGPVEFRNIVVTPLVKE